MQRMSYELRVFQEDSRKVILADHAAASMSWVIFALRRVEVMEDISHSSGCVKAELKRSDRDESILIEAPMQSGTGAVGAFFTGLIASMQVEHPSLRGIAFTSYDMHGKMGVTSPSKKDAPVTVTVGVTNGKRQELVFSVEGASVLSSGLDAVLYAVEFFVNAEIAFRRLKAIHKEYENIRDHHRMSNAVDQLSKLVSIADFSAVVI